MKTKHVVLSLSIAMLSVCSLPIFSQFDVQAYLKRVRLPLITRRVSVDCSVDLMREPITLNDVAINMGHRLHKIGGDLSVAGGVMKDLSIRLLKYAKNNPADAALITGGLVGIYLISSYIINSMGTNRCPCRSCHCNNRH